MRLATFVVVLFLLGGCARHPRAGAELKPTAFGSTITEVSGGKQVADVGAVLDQPVVVQVNDAQGNGVAGAAVYFRGPAGVAFAPPAALTDSSGQVSTNVTLGGIAGHYALEAATKDSAGKPVVLRLDEIALGYREELGRQVALDYCVRCHDPESTPERVSNMENLSVRPHAFTDGATLNRISDADLLAIVAHGGAALGRSPEMPPYGYTLTKNQLEGVIAYIRAVADPPYQSAGVTYAQK